MVAWTGHVWQVGSDRLNLVHKRVTHQPVIRVHVIGEVANMKDGVVHSQLNFLLESHQGLENYIFKQLHIETLLRK